VRIPVSKSNLHLYSAVTAWDRSTTFIVGNKLPDKDELSLN